ncbi:uncharacterized protein FA14DRAFT_148864 [Meira miltonrushii]|uniref:non-specific serine/threonine protein kinase n=1 Tax=Meira miltonrushii TaxID=1280837 RepID=A0A316VB10_9BASI|nr:uncharacterized protein FA14DRAFT_148864 [Meira miltonrushii]PWN34454.1 hypothetical protein FA14DRAFT_148864 [Meira miltonrushii]
MNQRGRSKLRDSVAGEGRRPSDTDKDITIDSIRRHIHHRLALSKENCDRELRKIIMAINAFVEEGIQEQQMKVLQQQQDEQDEIESRELTSTSTSRSHSPMPGAAGGQTANLYGAESPQYSPARRMRPLPPDDAPLDPFIVPLQDLVSIAMDVLDTTIHNLTSRTGACREIISSVQDVGRAWEENPLWPGRGWYVQLLLAVAGLSRVVEWWEAERGFWNFAEDGDENDQKPIKFFMANANRTPSQQSSATNSPAIEPADRKATFGEHIDSLRSTHSSTPILASALDDEDENGDLVKADDLKNSDVDLAANTSTAAALPSSVKESQNILMELSLDGERFLYLSPAWQTVLGSDPAELFDRPIEEVLAPGDAQTFAEATQQLQVDDSRTVEAAFRLLVHPSIIPDSDGVTRYYQEMEGKGMLMQDRQSGSSSHTMWVFKPTGPPEPEEALGPQKPSTAGVGDLSVAAGTSTFDTAGQQHPFLSTEPLLCRICERDVPTWFFEKHSEICNEIHRLEMEISESNEILADLRRSARGIVTQIEASEEVIEYRSIPLSTPAASTLPPTALEVANRSLSPRHPNPAAVRKAHLRALNALIDILRIAGTISTPATKDDADSIEKQRLLSPDSESKIVQVRNWKMVSLPSEDAAFDLLIADVDAAMRRKLSAVNRMLNTIVYVETVRMEWEQRITADFAEEDESLAGARKSQDDSEEQHHSSSTISHSDVNQQENVASGVNSVDVPMTAHSSSAPKSTAGSAPSGSAGQEDDLDDMDGDASAVLLEQYDDAAVPGSTTLSARGDELGREEDIPAVETSMGGSVLRPIPIPTKANIAPRIQRTYLQTPPLSPRHSPKEMTIPLRTVKDRRVSHSLRAMGAHSPHLSASAGGMPISPRIPPMAPSSRPTASSIKDFDIIKPISKGAFGSVFLTRKRTTGDYFAIKVLKKSDMIAKNQITNVKAERMILMTQTQSPFVVKLFFTFQSSESLFLVMEYLPGGDLANLVKALGTLSEDWTRQFVAEVVNGLEMLHAQGVVHRDMKPDNLLIDQKGHLKLTDFGLSKIGLLGRQNRQQMQAPSHAAGSHTGRGSVSGTGSTPPSSIPSGRVGSIPDTPYLIGSQPFYVGTPTHPRGRIMSASTDASDSSGSEGVLTYSQALSSATTSAPRQIPSATLLDSPKNPFASTVAGGHGSGSAGAIGSSTGQIGSGSGAQLKKFVGTPDYLAPESILGLGMDDAAVDWWALGVILYEFLYGYPPFHASTPEKVFDNILSRNISWDDEDVEVSAEARDLMERLMCTDRKNRLGANGAQEIKAHPFFAGIDWDHLIDEEGPFVPQITDPESTDYFDLRGAAFMDFQNEEGNTSTTKEANETYAASNMGMKEFAKAIEGHARFSQTDEFGSFSYKNLPVLKQANDEVIKKMRGDQLNSMSAAMEQHQAGTPGGGIGLIHGRHRSISGKVVTPSSHRGSAVWMPAGPPSPTTSISSQSSVPSKSTAPTSPRSPMGSISGSSATGPLTSMMERKRSQFANTQNEEDLRRTSLPTRLRTTSTSTSGNSAGSRQAIPSMGQSGSSSNTNSPAIATAPLALGNGLSSTTNKEVEEIHCMIAEDNPISARMLQGILTKLGCNSTTVRNGAEALRMAMGETKYSVLFVDVTLPIVSGQDVAKMIKSTRNINAITPIVALASFSGAGTLSQQTSQAVDNLLESTGGVFDAVMAKPIDKTDVCNILPRFGFMPMTQRSS